MPLKITRASDPITVDRIVVCVYAFPGVGKTSLGFSAAKPLLLDFDGGAHRAARRGDCVQVKTWGEVAGIAPADLAGYSTVVIDTAGRAVDALATDVYNRDPKFRAGANLSLKAYGAVKGEFAAFLARLKGSGLDVVLLVHADEQRSGDEVKERLDVQGASKGEIYKQADVMGRLVIENRARVLTLDPSDTAFGKNPAGLEPLVVPNVAENDHFLADVIATVKQSLNKQADEALVVAAALDAWKARIEAAQGVDDLNALVLDAGLLDERVQANAKRALVAAAKKRGLVLDGGSKTFVSKEARA